MIFIYLIYLGKNIKKLHTNLQILYNTNVGDKEMREIK
jgi:hypothetical protein